MRVFRTRVTDATFELNLAPFLDIIVATIPMLLLSVAFIQVKVIETPIPQVVAEAINKQRQNPPPVSVTLTMSKSNGFTFLVMNKGKQTELKVAGKLGEWDFTNLTTTTMQIKRDHPGLFKLDFKPSSEVAYDEIVKAMDAVRRVPAGQAKVAFLDEKSGQKVETDLMFPDVVFANIVGE